MKKIILLSILLLSISTIGYSTTWTVINVGFTFSPNVLSITTGDTVNFILGGEHNAREVSEATWMANGNTPLPGGFETPFGGGMVFPEQLTIGTHWYVCSVHASVGMKGIIIVQNVTGTEDNQPQITLETYPNPIINSMIIKSANGLIGSQYFITDLEGRPHLSGKLLENTSVDISHLVQGVYLIQVVGQRKQTLKIVKY
ncbi:MAG: T9SS type A sorting domain-containing protein [Bacteroidota bacterium]|nr:T9SS type A sorting domain-containing protein [Bacteroidota bacterium]